MLRKSLFTALTLGIAMLLVPIQAAAESGFAKVRANGSLATVGGPDTNTATSSRLAAGVYSVQFFGSYPSQTTADKVAVTTTAESAIYGVSNATVTSADSGQITVLVYTWVSSNTSTTVDNTFFVAIFTTPDPIAAPAGAKP